MKYGEVYSLKYGGTEGLASWERGSQIHAKDDTIFLGMSASGTMSELATDLSQDGEDFTVVSTWLQYASPSSKFDLNKDWSIEFQLTMNSSDEGGLFYRASGGAGVWIDVNTNTLDVRIDDGPNYSEQSYAITRAATDEDWVICFACEDNPDTTGTSDAVRYWVSAYCRTSGYQLHEHFDFYELGNRDAVTYLLSFAGTEAFAGTCTAIRISDFGHAPVEGWDDFGSRSTEVTHTHATRVELPQLTRASGYVDEGNFAGPAYSIEAGALRRRDLLMAGPVVNEIYRGESVTVAASDGIVTSMTNGPRWKAAPGETPWATGNDLMCSSYEVFRPVPPLVNRLHTRVCIELVSGDPIAFRCYSFTRVLWSAAASPGGSPLGIGGIGFAPKVPPAKEPFKWARSGLATISAVDRVWLDLGSHRLEKDGNGWTYLALAAQPVNSDTDSVFKVWAWTVEPLYRDPRDSGLSALEGEFEW